MNSGLNGIPSHFSKPTNLIASTLLLGNEKSSPYTIPTSVYNVLEVGTNQGVGTTSASGLLTINQNGKINVPAPLRGQDTNFAESNGMLVVANDSTGNLKPGFVCTGASGTVGLATYGNGGPSNSFIVYSVSQATGALAVGTSMTIGGINNNLVSGQIGFANNSTTLDAWFMRSAAATFQFGTSDAAAPVAQTIQVQSVVAGTANTAGVDWTLNASKGTGTGASGGFVFKTAVAGTTGTAQNALVTSLTIKNGVPVRPSFTVATLPAAATAGAGAMAWVTDATATTFLSTVAGGGANKVPVSCDGTNWVIG